MHSQSRFGFRMLRSAAMFGAVLAFSSGALGAAPPPPPAVEIVAADFGLFDTKEKDEVQFRSTRVVPHREGQRYGWVLELRTTRRSVSVREEYLVPNVAKAEKSAEARKVERPGFETIEIDWPRRNQVSQRQLVPVDGKIFGEWAIGPNEPAGRRHLEVIVEGQLAASFEYEVK